MYAAILDDLGATIDFIAGAAWQWSQQEQRMPRASQEP
jgi:hypothetical protein